MDSEQPAPVAKPCDDDDMENPDEYEDRPLTPEFNNPELFPDLPMTLTSYPDYSYRISYKTGDIY
jgi:hypothetical protein